eukprot:m.1086999 g.1086999  ORF g.1086999 m.1086999 type:complete len:532 (-) comp24282_c1_seq2:744-2339(-)
MVFLKCAFNTIVFFLVYLHCPAGCIKEFRDIPLDWSLSFLKEPIHAPGDGCRDCPGRSAVFSWVDGARMGVAGAFSNLLPPATLVEAFVRDPSDVEQFPFFGRPGLDNVLNSSNAPSRAPSKTLNFRNLMNLLHTRSVSQNSDMDASDNDDQMIPYSRLYFSAKLFSFANGTLEDASQGHHVDNLADIFRNASMASPGVLQGNIWFSRAPSNGKPKTCTPLHYDASTNLYFQLAGFKTVVLLPPRYASSLAAHKMYTPGSTASDTIVATGTTVVYPFGSSLHRTSQLGKASTLPEAICTLKDAVCVTLEAGDALLIPPYWLHHVCTDTAGKSDGYLHDCDSAGLPDPLTASLSVWSESNVQLNARRLQALEPPMDAAWDSGEVLTATLFRFQLIAGSLYGSVRSSLQARYERLYNTSVTVLPAKYQRVLCGVGISARSLKHLWPASPAAVDRATDEQSERARIAVLPSVKAYVSAAKSLVWNWGDAGSYEDSIRVLILTDYLESLLLRHFKVLDAATARAHFIPHVIATCL